MRTKQGKGVTFQYRNVIIISHDQYMVASDQEIGWSIEQELIVLVLTYASPNFIIAVYDMQPREITTKNAVRVARHCIDFMMSQAKLN